MAPPARTPTMGQGVSMGGAYGTTPYGDHSPTLAYGRDSEDSDNGEPDDDEDEDRVHEEVDAAEVAQHEGDGWLDVDILVQAMGKCNQLYDEHDQSEFYAMVAEEYCTMHPECQDPLISTIERNEVALRRYALAKLNGNSVPVGLEVPDEVKIYERELLGFYKILVEVGEIAEVPRSDVRPLTPSPSNHPESPSGSAHSNAEHTDGSASNPATPVVNEAGEDSQVPGETATPDASHATTEADQKQDETTVVVRSNTVATATSSLTLSDPNSGKIAYRQAWEVLADLTTAREESSDRLRLVEERVKAERALVTQRKQEFKQLKAIVKSYRVRDKEKKRLAAAVENDRNFEDDGEGGRSLEEDRKALRKEIKRYKRLQETLTLKFQLLQSETKNHEMAIEAKVAELKRECLDSYLFADGALS